jgi:antitoxin component YwqK of YwqJK toxin-antitoxin module
MNPNDPITNRPLPTKPLRHIINYYPNSNNKHQEYNLNENNQYHGLYELWHPNGQIWIRCNYQNGLRHSLYEHWYLNGQIRIRCTFKNDRFHSLYESWYPDGSLEYRRNYNNGKFES